MHFLFSELLLHILKKYIISIVRHPFLKAHSFWLCFISHMIEGAVKNYTAKLFLENTEYIYRVNFKIFLLEFQLQNNGIKANSYIQT